MLPLKLLTYIKAIHCQNWYVTLICQQIITFFVPLKNVSSALNNILVFRRDFVIFIIRNKKRLGFTCFTFFSTPLRTAWTSERLFFVGHEQTRTSVKASSHQATLQKRSHFTSVSKNCFPSTFYNFLHSADVLACIHSQSHIKEKTCKTGECTVILKSKNKNENST